MEAIENTQITIPNIRQTKGWEKYFNLVGWNSARLSNGSLIVYYKTPFGSFGKLQRPSILTRELLTELNIVCRRYRLIFLKLEPSVNQDQSLLREFDYVVSKAPLSPTTTAHIDLELSKETLWKNISRSGKYSITRGKREGAVVEFIKDPSKEQLKYFYDEVQSYTSNNKGFYIPSFKDLLLRKRAFGSNTFLSFVYNKDSNLCGGKFYLTYDTTVFYLSGGTTKLGASNKTGFVQMWESITYFKNLDFKILDLDGVYDARFPAFTESWLGFSRFKNKFGGSVFEYPSPYIKWYVPFLKSVVTLLHADL